MINAVRTLLHNTSGPADFAWPGEEYLPPEFRERQPTPSLGRIRRVLFGSTPDRFMKNYRLSQFMPILHASCLAPWIYHLDPRISYEFGAQASRKLKYAGYLRGQPWAWSVQPEQAQPHVLISFQEGEAGCDATGLCWWEWAFSRPSPSQLDMVVLRGAGLSRSWTLQAETDGFSQWISLGPQLSIRCRIDFLEPWQLIAVQRPSQSVAQLLHTLEERLPEDLHQLWDTDEPLCSCREVHRTSLDFAERLSAILLAVAYRSRDLPVVVPD